MSTSRRFDPRDWAIDRPRLTVAVVLLLTAVMLFGNVITRKGGIMDDPIIDQDNPYRRSDLYVKAKQAEGFHGQEYVPFILKFPRGISTPADLRRIRDFTESTKEAFGAAVLSLSEIPEYIDTGEDLLNDPYVPAGIGEDFDVAGWKERVAADPTVYGTFVGREFDWAAVIRYLPPGYDEIEEFRRAVEYLEGREIPWWEWLYKTDILPPRDVGVSGWVVGRGLLDQALVVDNFTLVGIGLALTIPLFVWCLGSLREALIGVLGAVLMGVLWARGSIGLFDLAGFEIRERISTLLVYTNCIVQGVSFVLHKFEAFHHAHDKREDLTERWRAARSNDHLIGATGLIAIFGFATLYWFQVLSIRELGLLSAMAVAYQLVLVVLWVPALHLLIRPQRSEWTGSRLSHAAAVFQRGLEGLAAGATVLVTRFSPRLASAIWGLGTVALAVTAVTLVLNGKLLIKTLPLNFIKGTLVERTAQFLNQPGRLGFDFLEFLVEPAGADGDIYDPAFLRDVQAYQAQLRWDTDGRELVSILNQIRRVSEQSLGKPLPESRVEARAVFNIIEADLSTAVARQLYYRDGLRLTVSYQGDDTATMGAITDAGLRLAREQYPGLQVSSFGKISLSAQVDRYIRNGKPLNLFSSQIVVIFFCLIGIWLHNRRTRSRRRRVKQTLGPLVGGFFMSAPFVFASAVMILLMIVFHIPLDAVTASITALAINASVDFAIYYAAAYQDGLAAGGDHGAAVHYAMKHKGRVVLEDMTLNAVCFLPLIASRFEPIRDVGWIMMVMLPACAFGTVVIMPALFYLGLRPATAARRSKGGLRERDLATDGYETQMPGLAAKGDEG